MIAKKYKLEISVILDKDNIDFVYNVLSATIQKLYDSQLIVSGFCTSYDYGVDLPPSITMGYEDMDDVDIICAGGFIIV